MFPHADTAALRRCRPLFAAVLGLCIFAGCSLFPAINSVKNVELNRLSLPPIQTPQDSIQLEVVFVDRPADDPLLGQALWREIDQISAIPAETRELLHENGFQIGHSGSSPPQAVQTLLGMVTDSSASDVVDGKPMIGMRKRLPPGVETEVQANEPIEKCQMKIVEGDRARSCDYEQVRCMFRMKSVRLRDGWIRIDFQPEIHHGDYRVRTTATEEGWSYQNRQSVDARHAQQFSLTMNVGEIAIITASSDHPDSMGEFFFFRDGETGRRQRLLIVRVADAGKSSSPY